MNPNQIILNFHNFILACWPQINIILNNLDWDDNPYFIDHWLQSNWELLVERQLLDSGCFFPPYGYDTSPECRQTRVGSVATHRLMVRLSSSENKFEFVNFLTVSSSGNRIEPPFDKVGVRDSVKGEITYTPLELVEFYIESI
jgi:hypothetical protein